MKDPQKTDREDIGDFFLSFLKQYVFILKHALRGEEVIVVMYACLVLDPAISPQRCPSTLLIFFAQTFSSCSNQ